MCSRPRPGSSTPSNGCGAAPCGPSSPTSGRRAPTPTDAVGAACRGLADALLAALLAPSCAACDAPLTTPSTDVVCADCWRAILRFSPPLCSRCGEPLASWRSARLDLRCARCRRGAGYVATRRAIGPYEGALRAIVHALKYGGARRVAPPLARLMRIEAADLIADADFAVPVPLHRARRRARGFNQAADLARGLGLPVLPVLRRVRATPPQVSLPAAQRHRNVREAFALARPWQLALWPPPLTSVRSLVAGRCVLLVDDVATTGATLEACAQVLLREGAREVRAVTAAQAVSGRPR